MDGFLSGRDVGKQNHFDDEWEEAGFQDLPPKHRVGASTEVAQVHPEFESGCQPNLRPIYSARSNQVIHHDGNIPLIFVVSHL